MKNGDERHKYERLALDLRRLIEAGTYHPGDRLPSLRAMSQQDKITCYGHFRSKTLTYANVDRSDKLGGSTLGTGD
jgi:hypothetical protein